MLINFEEMVRRLKTLGSPVFQDKASKDTPYPYWVYSFASEDKITASGTNLVHIPEYQLSYFTKGTRRELEAFRRAFKDVGYSNFSSIQGDENDDTVTNFYAYVKVIDDG